MNKGKLWFYRDKYTSFLPYAFTQTERFNAKTNCFSEICLSASIFQSQTLIYRCTALHHHHGCRQNLNAKACFNLWYGLKGEDFLSLSAVSTETETNNANLCWMTTKPKIDPFRYITCKLQYRVLYLSIQIKIFYYGTVNIINESRWNSQEKFW